MLNRLLPPTPELSSILEHHKLSMKLPRAMVLTLCLAMMVGTSLSRSPRASSASTEPPKRRKLHSISLSV